MGSTRKVPWDGELPSDALVLFEALNYALQSGRRPTVPDAVSTEHSAFVALMMQRCWASDPANRPTFSEAARDLAAILQPFLSTLFRTRDQNYGCACPWACARARVRLAAAVKPNGFAARDCPDYVRRCMHRVTELWVPELIAPCNTIHALSLAMPAQRTRHVTNKRQAHDNAKSQTCHVTALISYSSLRCPSSAPQAIDKQEVSRAAAPSDVTVCNGMNAQCGETILLCRAQLQNPRCAVWRA